MTWTLLIGVLIELKLLPSQLYVINQLPTDSSQAKVLKYPSNLGVSRDKIGIESSINLTFRKNILQGCRKHVMGWDFTSYIEVKKGIGLTIDIKVSKVRVAFQ